MQKAAHSTKLSEKVSFDDDKLIIKKNLMSGEFSALRVWDGTY